MDSLTDPIIRIQTDEASRLSTLKDLDLLDTAPDPELDSITELAKEIFDTPIALISLIDEDRQWFKSNIGLEGTCQTERSVAFCDHAIRSVDVFVVEDATQDPRFQNNRLVKSEPYIRFYAGAPLITTEGYALGTLCVIDMKPKEWSIRQSRQLAKMANMVMHVVNNHRLTRRAGKLASELKVSSELNQNLAAKYRSVSQEIQTVLDNVPSRIWYKDDKNTILRANKAALESVNLSDAKDIEGRAMEELFPEMAAKYLKDDLEVISSGQPLRNIIESYAPREGEAGWMSVDKVPITDEAGNHYVLAVATDITELQNNRERLARLNDSLSDFAFVAAHDLQAPLRQSAMFLDLFKEEMDLADTKIEGEAEEFLDEAINGIKRMREMVRSIYDLHRLNEESITLEPHDLSSILDKAIRQSGDVLEQVEAEVSFEELPELEVSESLMVQLFQNLIVNACKYADAKPLQIRVHAKRNIQERQVLVMFEDNGVGIPADMTTKVFEPFKRLHSGGDRPGAGIGLALCKRIAALHDADLSVDSEYKDGARFVIAFNI